jgi:hypothetical protein
MTSLNIPSGKESEDLPKKVKTKQTKNKAKPKYQRT